MSNDGKIICKIDGARVHSVQHHIRDNHPEWTIERYREEFPNEPVLSERAADEVRRKRAEKAAAKVVSGMARVPLTDLFGFPADKVTTKGGRIVEAAVIDRSTLSADDLAFVPDIDKDYLFNIELTKSGLMALEMNKPGLFWGFHGTGKTSAWEQICAVTGRPFQRVQHTVNTEEAHVLGQYIVVQEIHTDPTSGIETVSAVTKFNPGPLTIAMIQGHVYCADEYDFAMPSVTAVYQPVLEGKPLVIKDAPPEFRVIRPHPNFRFVATGNTNGGGDETGLYQGTQIQNAANYSRFAVTEEVGYMEPKVEAAMIAGKSGIKMKDATDLVKFASEVRKLFSGGQISTTISPRELINAAQLGMALSLNWSRGLALAFTNRLSRADQEVCKQYCQRLFG